MGIEVLALSDDEAVCAECGGGVTWGVHYEGFTLTYCRTHLLSTAEKMKRAVRERDAWQRKYYAGIRSGKAPALSKST